MQVILFLQGFSNKTDDKLCKRCGIDVEDWSTTKNVWENLKKEALKVTLREDSPMIKLWKIKGKLEVMLKDEKTPQIVKKELEKNNMEEITKMMKDLKLSWIEVQKNMQEQLAEIRNLAQAPANYRIIHRISTEIASMCSTESI